LFFFLEQKESFIVLTNEFPFLYFESILTRPVRWLFVYYPTQRNSTFSDTKQYTVKVFLYNTSLLTCIGYLPVGATTHLCPRQDPDFPVRARIKIICFFSLSVLFFFQKTYKYKLQFLFHEFEVFSIQLKIRVICW
jgi:hypothetical protein